MFKFIHKNIFRTRKGTKTGNRRRRKYNINRLTAVDNFFKNSNCILIVDANGKILDHYACNKKFMYNHNVKGFSAKYQSLVYNLGKIKKVKCHNPNFMTIHFYNRSYIRIFKYRTDEKIIAQKHL